MSAHIAASAASFRAWLDKKFPQTEPRDLDRKRRLLLGRAQQFEVLVGYLKHLCDYCSRDPAKNLDTAGLLLAFGELRLGLVVLGCTPEEVENGFGVGVTDVASPALQPQTAQ